MIFLNINDNKIKTIEININVFGGVEILLQKENAYISSIAYSMASDANDVYYMSSIIPIFTDMYTSLPLDNRDEALIYGYQTDVIFSFITGDMMLNGFTIIYDDYNGIKAFNKIKGIKIILKNADKLNIDYSIMKNLNSKCNQVTLSGTDCSNSTDAYSLVHSDTAHSYLTPLDIYSKKPAIYTIGNQTDTYLFYLYNLYERKVNLYIGNMSNPVSVTFQNGIYVIDPTITKCSINTTCNTDVMNKKMKGVIVQPKKLKSNSRGEKSKMWIWWVLIPFVLGSIFFVVRMKRRRMTGPIL